MQSKDHLNRNILAVVDVETTGTKPGFHDLIEICVLPLDKFLKPDPEIIPFNLELIPMRQENIDFEALKIQRKDYQSDYNTLDKLRTKKEDIIRATLKGCEPYRAAELFYEWFERLKMPAFKRIMPIAHNWCFDREFIIDWIGRETFELIFDPRYRDTMVMSLYDNDCAGWHNEQYPYAKNNLQYLCTTLGIKRDKPHSALDDCVVTAELYKRLVTSRMF